MDNYILENEDLNIASDDYLEHVGVSKKDGAKIGSGRFPLGSGEHPYQRLGGLYGEYRKLKKKGISDGEIAAQLGMSSGDMRARLKYYKALRDSKEITQCVEYADKGLSNLEIAKKMGLSPTTVANRLKASQAVRESKIISTRNALKDKVDEVGWVEVGKGTENWMGITSTMLNDAVTTLYDEGYELYSDLHWAQGGSGQNTTVKVLARPGMTKGDVLRDKDNIKATMADVRSFDGGLTYKKKGPAVNVDSKRIEIRYADDPVSGELMDGVIELRRGVPDLDLGKAHYAQVRIAVDGKYYAKGMAVYADDLPDGIDIRVNSNKKREKGIEGALKPQKHVDEKDPNSPIDVNNPFGTNTKQEYELERVSNFYTDKDGKEHQSALNFVNEEGGWDRWSKNLPSQFLGKQPPALAKQQLNIDAVSREKKFEDIKKLTNPTLRATLLKDFADECDSAAKDLKAAALPRQVTAAIIPAKTLKETECYAPGFEDGEEVVLVRFPHAGRFELPRLKVNNRNRESKNRISNAAVDAICINPKTAQQLSGADFDGDTVLVLPTKKHDIKTEGQLAALKDYDPHTIYATTPEEREHVKIWEKGSKDERTQMGMVSNLITDMTLQGAPEDHIARAVKHSMVIIDVAKHKLNWKRSEQDNDIAELKKIYQPHYDEKTGRMRYGGANTLLSRAGKDVEVPGVKSYDRTNPETGQKEFIPSSDMVPVRRKTGEINPETGKAVYETIGWEPKKRSVPLMRVAGDAYKLTSGGSKKTPGTEMEAVYADYANRMMALGNEARKAELKADGERIKRNPTAVKTYAKEVSHLLYQLNEAKKNAPLERRAEAIAQAEVELAAKSVYGGITKGERSKMLDKALKRAREVVGAKRIPVHISDREWEAIQAGAIAPTNLKEMFKYADGDRLLELAMPKKETKLKTSYINLAKSMINLGYSISDVAKRFDVSPSTISAAINE